MAEVRETKDPTPEAGEGGEESLKADWELLRGRNLPEPDPTFPEHDPSDFILGTNKGRFILKITKEGRVQLGPGVELDEASELFWTNLALKRKGMEERLTHFGIMEQMLLQVADADRAYDQTQQRMEQPNPTAHDHQTDDLARRTLQLRLHALVDYARGLRRPTTSNEPR